MGSVGAGAGTIAFGFKGGIGTASRLVTVQEHVYTLGVLVQTNHGGRLSWPGLTTALAPPQADTSGSVVVVVFTDAPLDARQLARLARRAVYALARTGASFSGGSGDYAISVSTHPASAHDRVSHDAAVEPMWTAVQDCVDEAVLDSLVAAEPVVRWDGVVVDSLLSHHARAQQ